MLSRKCVPNFVKYKQWHYTYLLLSCVFLSYISLSLLSVLCRKAPHSRLSEHRMRGTYFRKVHISHIMISRWRDFSSFSPRRLPINKTIECIGLVLMACHINPSNTMPVTNFSCTFPALLNNNTKDESRSNRMNAGCGLIRTVPMIFTPIKFHQFSYSYDKP
jgi:hypothetical protein